jgi:hypothetical protein
MKSLNCTSESQRKCGQETTDREKSENEREREREKGGGGGGWRAREKTRARERGKTQNDRTLAASEVGRTPGTSSGRVFLFLFLRVDGLGNRWFSVNEGIQPVSALATFPVEVHNNVGPVPSLAGTKKCWSS